jgi:thiol-disulfide isomerase/thioredoxin
VGPAARLARLAALVLALAFSVRPAGAAPPGVEPPEALLVQSYPNPLPLPAVILTDGDDRQVALDRFLGQVVLLNFWATWCVPCRAEMPEIERLHRAYRDRGFVVVGVNFKESPGQVQGFMTQQQLTFPALLDRDGSASAMLRVVMLPVTLLLDREGRALWRAIGAREWDTPPTRAYLDRLLAAP